MPITSAPVRHKVVCIRWLLVIEADNTNQGRFVVQGFSTISGIDCGGAFVLVFKLQSIRMILAIAAKLDYEVHMLDVQTAFPNADVEEDVFIMMAPGYETNDKAGILS